jgi:zinc-ribbon domain
VRCGRCGNENAEGNRFCGMCGTSLVATAQDAAQSSGRAPAPPVPMQPVPVSPMPRPPVQAPLPGPVGFDSPTAERRPVAPRSFESKPFESKSSSGPVTTGPSFLGLSTPGPATDRHAERDPLRPSSNLDYLLDDEEEPKRGRGKPILVLVALVLAVGFGYLHWKQGGFDWLNAGGKKPAAAQLRWLTLAAAGRLR